MGDDDKEQPAPPAAPPSPAATARQSIEAQIELLPDILRAQREFGPQFTQEQLDVLREFGPQFADTLQDIQDQISPEISTASESLNEFLSGDDEAEFQRLLPNLQESVRSAQSVRGLGDISPLGSIEESAQIEQLRQNLKNRRLNIALSVSGRQPISALNTQGGVGQLVQNVNPESIFAQQRAIDQFNLGLFGQQSQNFQNQPPSISGQLLGGLGGAAVGGFGSVLGLGAAGSIPFISTGINNIR